MQLQNYKNQTLIVKTKNLSNVKIASHSSQGQIPKLCRPLDQSGGPDPSIGGSSILIYLVIELIINTFSLFILKPDGLILFFRKKVRKKLVAVSYWQNGSTSQCYCQSAKATFYKMYSFRISRTQVSNPLQFVDLSITIESLFRYIGMNVYCH